jgi:hypothetical protein
LVLPTSTANNMGVIVAENESIEQVGHWCSNNLVVLFRANDVNCFEFILLLIEEIWLDPQKRNQLKIS